MERQGHERSDLDPAVMAALAAFAEIAALTVIAFGARRPRERSAVGRSPMVMREPALR